MDAQYVEIGKGDERVEKGDIGKQNIALRPTTNETTHVRIPFIIALQFAIRNDDEVEATNNNKRKRNNKKSRAEQRRR